MPEPSRTVGCSIALSPSAPGCKPLEGWCALRGAALSPPSRIVAHPSGVMIAVYDDGRPFVAHPTLSDLFDMHGLAWRLRGAA